MHHRLLACLVKQFQPVDGVKAGPTATRLRTIGSPPDNLSIRNSVKSTSHEKPVRRPASVCWGSRPLTSKKSPVQTCAQIVDLL
jgi:hypothetical protein